MNNKNIIDKLIELHSIKDEWGFIWKLESRIEKSQLKIKQKDNQQSDYKTFTSRSVSDQQSADMLHNMPIFDYIPLSKEARSWVFHLKELWKRMWKIDETDSKIFDVVEDASDLGSWILYQWWKIEKRKVEEPYYEWWDLKFKSKERVEYFWIYSEYIPIENFYADWTTIENSNEVIWLKYWDRKDFIKAHELNKLYKNINEWIPKVQHYIENYKKIPKFKSAIWEEDIIQELRYYNKSEDKLIILANGEEVYNTPIPHWHKDLPFCKFDNHKYRDRFIQMGNYEMLDEPEKYIDAIRSQSVDVTKANIWFNAIPSDSDISPSLTKIWPFNFIEMENPSEIKHIWNNIQPSQLWDLENKAANDIIVLSWTDYRQQVLGSSWETAKKTSSRNAAQEKRINKILKKNSFKFYNRLARLRLADLKFINSIDKIDIPLKWYDYNWKSFDKVDWYWLYSVPKDTIKWDFDITLQTESLLWNSTEKDKENYLNFFQVFGNLRDENNKSIINQQKMIEIAWQKIWVDVDSLLEKEVINKDWKSIIDWIKAKEKWMDLDSSTPNNPNFIPWANRANQSWWVNVIGWGNTAQWII